MACLKGPGVIRSGSDLLTERQQTILDFIRRRLADVGGAPTVREIADAFGIRSTNGVNDHLRSLERKGYVRRLPNQARSIQLTGKTRPGTEPPICNPVTGVRCETGRCAA